MPIKARIDMLSTGIRTPVGVKVFGKDLETLEKVAQAVEAAVRKVPGASSAYAERVAGGYYWTSCRAATSSRATGSPSTCCRT